MIKDVLKQYFGHSEFRVGQEELVSAVLYGQDVFGIMPTGGGKSICYQIPSLIMSGITLVISPLISLMKDQIHSLKQSGINAAYINSTLNEIQVDTVLTNARQGKYKLVYVAPERLTSPRFLDFCYDSQIAFVAVDEAHCVSQWGHDFRPSYSHIRDFIARFDKRPVVGAYTATATQKVKEDIVNILHLTNPQIIQNSFDRANLRFEVLHPKKKYDSLIQILQDRKEQFGIIYCSTRSTVDDLHDSLVQDGFGVAKYHAGLSDTKRYASQDDFIYDRKNIMIATNAFGMGIDKSNISFVVHYNMPKDIESYYQEAGRAGRDDSLADCILLYSGQDLRTNLYLIENSEGRQYESDEQKELLQSKERERLKLMDSYCNTVACLRKHLLKYFGETISTCSNCGNCAKIVKEVDITIVSQKILSCIARTNEFYGRNTIIDILRGSKNKKILQSRLNKQSTYGICSESDEELRSIINFLVEEEYLVYTNGQYPIIKFGKYANKILQDKQYLQMKQEVAVYQQSYDQLTNKVSFYTNPLVARLKTLRKEIADKQGVPAFIIFHDSSIMDMSKKLPSTLQEFSRISGVGKSKLERYGSTFVECINGYILENNLQHTEGTIVKGSGGKNDITESSVDIASRWSAESGDKVNSSVTDDKANSAIVDDMQRDMYDTSKASVYNNTDQLEDMGSDDELLPISDIVVVLNYNLEQRYHIKRLTAVVVNDWLSKVGFLYSSRDDKGHIKRTVTELGRICGIIQEERMNGNNESYFTILYSKEMQQIIVNNLEKILSFRGSAEHLYQQSII